MSEEEIFKLKLDLANHVVKTTQHVIMIDENTDLPVGSGSGSLIIYRERCFFITVQHVTDKVGLETCIDLGHNSLNGNHVYRLGTMNYIDQFRVAGMNTANPELEKLPTLDIAYTEVRENFAAKQKDMQIGNYRINADLKRIHLSETDELPNTNECYSFFGRVRSKFDGWTLTQQPSLFLCIPYDRREGYYERFLLSNVITDPADFKGTSGAPIISESGEIVAFVCGGVTGTNHLYGFSSYELKKFLDIYIIENPV